MNSRDLILSILALDSYNRGYDRKVLTAPTVDENGVAVIINPQTGKIITVTPNG